MTTQPTLFDFADTRTHQGQLFDPNDIDAGDSDRQCQRCGRYLVRTETGYLCCPHGHGRLIAEI